MRCTELVVHVAARQEVIEVLLAPIKAVVVLLREEGTGGVAVVL